MLEKRPWLIVPTLLMVFVLVVFGTPVFAHYAFQWWNYWLPLEK